MNWIFIRGLTRGKSHWGEFSRMFLEFFPGSKIHFLDLPGNGDFSNLKSPWTVREYADFARQHSGIEKIEGPRYVLGFSLGGMVTLDWMSRYPEDFEGGVLINTSASNLSPFYHRFKINNLPKLFTALLKKTEKTWEEFIWDLTTHIAKDKDKVVAEWVQQAKTHPVATSNAIKQLFAASRFKFKGPAPKNRILLLAGRKDKLVRPKCSIQLSQYLNKPLRIHSRAGHDLTLEDPEWVLRTIEEWLNEFKE